MRFTAKQYAKSLFEAISETKPDHHEKILDNFVTILKNNNNLSLIDEIEAEFFSFSRAAEGVKLAEVTTATELDKHEEQKVVRELNSYVQGKVELKKKVDEGLVGGVVIKIEDELIDGSVKKQLRTLSDKLKK